MTSMNLPHQGAAVRRAFAMYQHLQAKTDVDYDKALEQIHHTKNADCWRMFHPTLVFGTKRRVIGSSERTHTGAPHSHRPRRCILVVRTKGTSHRGTHL